MGWLNDIHVIKYLIFKFNSPFYKKLLYTFQHFNHSMLAPFDSSFFSSQFLFPLQTSPRSVRSPRFSSRTNGSTLYPRNAISGWMERIRIHRAMWFSSDHSKRRVPCGSSTHVCISAKMGASMQPLDRIGRVMKEGGRCFGNFYARVSSFISAAVTIEKLAGGRRCVKTVDPTRMDPSFAAVAAIPAKQIPCHLWRIESHVGRPISKNCRKLSVPFLWYNCIHLHTSKMKGNLSWNYSNVWIRFLYKNSSMYKIFLRLLYWFLILVILFI